ncbi:MAG TPA: GMC family oxidoreductase [Symbiobacteriaceae bacterium]|nr:GMC family oxidoreductase [Symbiobacteriaceae bacterium]
MREPNPCDVVIVGAGAAGGVAAARLAAAGLSVVVLEAGPHWNPQKDWASDERATANQAWRETRLTAGKNPLKLAKNNSGRGVGGGTVHFNGVCLRLTESDFRMRTQDGVGVDWPIEYADLAPYYDLIERETAACGPREWPWAPKRPPYPYPPRDPLSGPAQLFQQGCERLGMNAVPAPLFILSAPFEGRPACINRGFCVQGCTVNAKFSTLITYIPRAIKAGAEVRAECQVTGIEVGEDGRVTGVTYLHEGETCRQEAAVVLLAAFAIETPRLLLLSTSALFPHGLANGSGMVGKRLLTHLSHDVWARFDREVLPYKGTPVLATSLDCYATNPQHDWVRGFSLHAHGFRPVEFVKGIAAKHGIWGQPLQELLRDYNFYTKVTMVGEVLPSDENRVTLSTELDRFGLPAPLITFSYGENEHRMGQGALQKMRAIMGAAGGQVLFEGADTAHLMGGCVMGDNPATSVVDSFGQAHEVPNLFITGAAIFPTAGAANPTLTVMALAARTADRIIELAAHQAL